MGLFNFVKEAGEKLWDNSDVNLNFIGTGNVEFLEVLGDFVALTFMIGQVIPQLFACFFYEVKKSHSILLLTISQNIASIWLKFLLNW